MNPIDALFFFSILTLAFYCAVLAHEARALRQSLADLEQVRKKEQAEQTESVRALRRDLYRARDHNERTYMEQWRRLQNLDRRLLELGRDADCADSSGILERMRASATTGDRPTVPPCPQPKDAGEPSIEYMAAVIDFCRAPNPLTGGLR